MEEALEAARPERQRAGQARPRHRLVGAGAAWAIASQCRTVINPDGSVSIEIGTQDLGTGTRTIITQVAAETLGLQMGQVKLVIGNNDLPPDGGSGGSTTVGGVSTSTRKSTINALAKLFEAVAPALGAQPDQLEAVDGNIRVKGTPEQEHDLGGGLQEARHEYHSTLDPYTNPDAALARRNIVLDTMIDNIPQEADALRAAKSSRSACCRSPIELPRGCIAAGDRASTATTCWSTWREPASARTRCRRAGT